MDATRTEHDVLCRCVEAAIRAGATTINVPDTVGYTVPEEYYDLSRCCASACLVATRRLLHPLPQRSRPRRRQQPGRRCGRRASDRMHHQRPRRARRQRRAGRGRDGDQTRADVMPYWTGMDTSMITRASQARLRRQRASRCSTTRPSSAKRLRPRVRHPSGRRTEERPNLRDHDAGKRRRALKLAGHGQAFWQARLPRETQGAGLRAWRQRLRGRLPRFKNLADRKKHVFDEDIETLVDHEIASAHDRIKVLSLTVIAAPAGLRRRP